MSAHRAHIDRPRLLHRQPLRDRRKRIMEDGAGLSDLSMLPDGARVPAGELWTGSPAAPAGRLAPEPDARPPWNAASSFVQALGILLFPFVPLVAVFPGLMLVAHLGHYGRRLFIPRHYAADRAFVRRHALP